MRITVPGNMLLFGEYAITYPDGLGIAAATKEKLIIDILPASQLTISGEYGNETYRWTKGDPFPSRLIEHIVSTLNLSPSLHIHLDARQFYYPDGTKKGYGSSAAVTIGLLSALLEGQIGSIDQLAWHALQLHRSFQGGRGSGYDIYASCLGGVGLFKNSNPPEWQPLNPDLYREIYLLRGAYSCDTRSVLKELKHFETAHPLQIKKYIKTSNALIQQLSLSLRLFHRASLLNRWINRHLAQKIQWEEISVKPLGAGGEIGAALTPMEHSKPLHISLEGVQCLQ
ncbi:putative phosphomevalonate kinase [Waddlia chondrophila 2032/99]|uniref:Putative phosphomevalonate kinase n=2 Tax=Waddlia chondrophila TaxID=71667 RepID=D6YWG5_WADCW|nr:phosphomevalonate kinase [Waddlia chondrophila]ADI38476.1 putative phosphomevalonate kinase [Waddlia chondrophila WSU 86-1044]CCB91558.1 putative phosphomevalonate kinase [Waddlia chondrophila 2032/99]